MPKFEQMTYGFKWGGATITRIASDDRKGFVIIELETPKYKFGKALQIRVTKTGKITISNGDGKWVPPKDFTALCKQLKNIPYSI
jgi:hypothetical protein